jgi:kumamolisin
MKSLVSAVPMASFVLASLAPAQIRSGGAKVVTPDSSIEKPSHISLRSHTNIHVLLPTKTLQEMRPFGAPYAGFAYETPAFLACVYGLATAVANCWPSTASAIPTGGSKMIVIVDAYDAPNAAKDLAGRYGVDCY